MSKVYDVAETDAVQNAADQAGFSTKPGSKVVVDWSVDEVVHWLVKLGFEDVAEVFGAHAVKGSVLPKLSVAYLKEMGLQSIGRRIQLYQQIKKVQAVSRAEWRRGMVWTDNEYRESCCMCTCPCPSFCCLRPSLYKVTNAKVAIVGQKTKQCRTIPCLCAANYSMVYDLSDLTDVEVNARSEGACSCFKRCFCCGEPSGNIVLKFNTGKRADLKVRSSTAQRTASMIINAREEAILKDGLIVSNVI